MNLARQSSIGTTFKSSHWYLGHSENLACPAFGPESPLSLGVWVVRGHREEPIWMI